MHAQPPFDVDSIHSDLNSVVIVLAAAITFLLSSAGLWFNFLSAPKVIRNGIAFF